MRRRVPDLFPWGDGLDYSMRLHWFEDMEEDGDRPYDMEEPNFFGLSIAYDLYAGGGAGRWIHHLRRRRRVQYLRRSGAVPGLSSLFAPLVSRKCRRTMN